MSLQITIDQTGTASVQFFDDHGDVTTVPDDPTSPGALATISFASDTPSVATVDPSSGAVTPVAVGAFTLEANVTNSDGTPTLEPDGTTPFNATLALEVVAGAAATDALTVQVA